MNVRVLHEFLDYYLGQEENAARSAATAGRPIWRNSSTGVIDVGGDNGVFDLVTTPDGRIAQHMAVHDPQSVLVDIAAKRKLIDWAFTNAASIDGEWGCGHEADQIRAGICTDYGAQAVMGVLLPLAAKFSSEAGFAEAWRIPGLDNRIGAQVLDGELGHREIG